MSMVPCECSREEDRLQATGLAAQANYTHFGAPTAYPRRQAAEGAGGFHRAFADASSDESKPRSLKSLFAPSPSKGERKASASSSSNDAAAVDSAEKMKTKLKSMWNNVKYGWTVKMKTNFSKTADLWVLGKCYRQTDPTITLPEVDKIFEAFRLDCYSRIWLTYRREFQSLAGSSLTTDCGWGCMLRSGQMMLAEAFIRHFLGRDWRSDSLQREPRIKKLHHDIVRWFGDVNSIISPFSLHHLVAIGASTGKKAGDWYGPSSVAHILKQAMEQAGGSHEKLREMCVYVAQDCTVYKQDVYDLCLSSEPPGWKGVIILIPARLGGEAFNVVYTVCLKQMLVDQNCIGIIGGRPKHSLYFIGWQDEKLIHLDPHYCQEVVDVTRDDFDLQSFHCSAPRKMSFTRMDPSCTIGFYCQREEDFNNFVDLSLKILQENSQRGEYPVFIVADGRSVDCTFQPPRRFEEMTVSLRPRNNSYDSDDDDDEVFVVL